MADFNAIATSTAFSDVSAADLLPLVYDELRRLAANMLRRQPSNQTLQPTALVHEAFVRLTNSPDAPLWKDHQHFFSAAARAMRWILVDVQRRKNVFQKIVANGHVGAPVESDDPPMIDLIALDDALDQLAKVNPMAAHLVELRYFAGLTLEEAAKTMGVSRHAVSDKWAFARAWLQLMLEGEKGD